MIGLILSLSHLWSMSAPYLAQNNTPIPPAGAKIVALTFDDGPNANTLKILDILKSANVPATFFVLGSNITKNRATLRREIAEGHTVGTHTFNHFFLPKRPTSVFMSEVLFTDLMVWQTTGVYPRYFRFPYGAEDARIGQVHRGPIIGWDVDAYDWKAKNPTVLANNILAQTRSGSIVLLHDIKADTTVALPLILQGLRDRGFQIVPLDTLLASTKHLPTKNLVYRNRTFHLYLGRTRDTSAKQIAE